MGFALLSASWNAFPIARIRHKLSAAYALAVKAERSIPGDSGLKMLRPMISYQV
jgi:hypothetical protein